MPRFSDKGESSLRRKIRLIRMLFAVPWNPPHSCGHISVDADKIPRSRLLPKPSLAPPVVSHDSSFPPLRSSIWPTHLKHIFLQKSRKYPQTSNQTLSATPILQSTSQIQRSLRNLNSTPLMTHPFKPTSPSISARFRSLRPLLMWNQKIAG